ncbi:MAG TPA: kelch repeat-containing protein [Candidatus Eisenbacteria bacterium]|nr:kelch repeat-containing protein [Candidatus Eisenbacteria bacterium]
MWRDGHCTVYDSARDRLLVLGGYAGQWNTTDVLWSVSLGGTSSLTEVPTDNFSTVGIGVYGAAAIYDPLRDRVITFGGFWANGSWSGGGDCPGNAYELTLSGTPTWNGIEVAGDYSPPDRAWSSAIYDPVNDRMVLFGGQHMCGASAANDVWALSLSGTPTWTQMTPTGTPPPGRSGHTAVYDVPRNRMLVYGGYDGNGNTLGDVYALTLTGSPSWSLVSPNGGPPVARGGQTAITDAPGNRMLIFGGWDTNGIELFDTWSLSYTNPIRWTQLTPTGPTPAPQYTFASIYDPIRQRMLSFAADQFWTLGNLAGSPAWSMLTPAGQVPPPRMGAGVIYDASRQRLVVFGGSTNPGQQLARDLWMYSFTGNAWSQSGPTATWPTARKDATATYDPAGDRLILFGGADEDGVLNDTWQLSLSSLTWTHLTPTGTPPPARSVHTAILDSPRNRIVVYGGADLGSNALSDVWALSLAGGTSWSALSPTGGPAPARQYHVSVFDSPRNRMLTHGWNDDTVWALTLSGTPSWSQLTTAGGSPPPLGAHLGVYDPVRDRLIVSYGEIIGGGTNHATYALDLSAAPTWSTMETSNTLYARGYTQAMWDATHDRMLVFGGNQFGTNYNDIWALSFPPSFGLTLTAAPSTGGLIQQDPSGACQPANSQVTLYPYPFDYYGFTGWSGDASGNANPLTITMDANKTIVANFATYVLTAQSSPTAGGTVSKSPDQPSYGPGSQVTLTANAAAGYAFTGWSGDASGTTNPLIVTMDGQKNITANFVTYALATSVAPAGSGTVSRSPNLPSFPPGTQVTLTANPATGFGFINWSGDASGSTNPLTVTMDGPKNITANFTGYSLNLTITPSGSGTVAKSPNQSVFPPGSQVTLTASTSPFPFLGWSGDASGTDNPLVITMDASKNITASFDAFALTTNVSPSGSGTVTRSPNQSAYPGGSTVELTAVPADGYAFSQWNGDVTGTSNPVSLLMDANKTVTASFVTPPAACGAWTMAATASLNRAGASAAWDPVNGRMLRFGGYDGANFLNDLWQFTVAGGWTQLAPTGGPPSPRNAAGFLYDPIRSRMLVICGNAGSPPNDVWQLSMGSTPTWSLVATAGTTPPGRFAFSTIYDPLRDRVILFGGYPNTNQVWELSLAGTPTWTQLSPSGTPPAARYGHVGVYDPVRDRMLIQGGAQEAGSLTIFSDLWALSLSGAPAWTQLSSSGDPAPQSYLARGIYDTDRDRMLVISGLGPGGSNMDAVWGLSLEFQPYWTRIPTGGLPLTARYFHSAVYEPNMNLVLVANGITPAGSYRQDTKRLDCAGGSWLQAVATNGNVQFIPAKGCYAVDEHVTLIASPSGGAGFNQWLGDASGNANPLDVTMDTDKTIFAEIVGRTTAVEDLPLAFALEDIRPNPNPGPVRVTYALPRAANVRLGIYDITGRLVGRLAAGVRPAGRHTATWDGLDRGRSATAGIYFVRFETPAGSWSQKVALIR